jgi:uncharacterized protein (TIGR02001 family)
MKNSILAFVAMVLTGLVTESTVYGQEEQENSKFSVGTDLFSNYVWRGTRFGTGPAVQPQVKLETGGLTIGVWGSFDFNGYSEADPFISYSFPFGLSLGLTDYYYPGLPLFDVSPSQGSHAYELNGGFSTGGLDFSANYILNAAGGAGSAGSDLYFQAGYSFSVMEIFLGAGNGWHTSDGDFNICNIGLGLSREISITDGFSIPVTGQVIVNPDREQLFLVAGLSF